MKSIIYQLLVNINNIEGDIERSDRKNMRFKQDVESFQIGLSLLGYELPVYGVDGLFGPETERALNKFKRDNKLEENGIFSTGTKDLMYNKNVSLSPNKFIDNLYKNLTIFNRGEQIDIGELWIFLFDKFQ